MTGLTFDPNQGGEGLLSKKISKYRESIQSSTTPVRGLASNKSTLKFTNKSQEISPFPSVDHKAAMNRRESMTTQCINNTNDPQKKYRLGTVSENIILEGLNRFHDVNLTLSSDGSRQIDVWFV